MPCPFCGGEAKLFCDTEMGGTQYRVMCTNCPADVGRYWYWKKEDAIRAWNRRIKDEYFNRYSTGSL